MHILRVFSACINKSTSFCCRSGQRALALPLPFILAAAFMATAGLNTAHAENITYDGSDPSMLRLDPFAFPFSLFPNSLSGNTVQITGGNISGNAFAGAEAGSGNVFDNRLIISGGSVGQYVYGGYSHSGNAVNNSVTILGGSVGRSVYGGDSDYGDAVSNSVTISNGSVGEGSAAATLSPATR